MLRAFDFFLLLSFFIGVSGCSSGPAVQSQAYARMPNQKTFEYEFPQVWKAIETAVKNVKILERDPDEVEPLEMKKLTQRSLETDWIYSQSRDKYQEYTVNDTPRKKYLQVRVKFSITARSVMGGTDVVVSSEEEIERLQEDGTSAGYSSVSEADSSRRNEIIEKINLALLSAAP